MAVVLVTIKAYFLFAGLAFLFFFWKKTTLTFFLSYMRIGKLSPICHVLTTVRAKGWNGVQSQQMQTCFFVIDGASETTDFNHDIPQLEMVEP